MKILLTTLNSKYTHTSLALRYLEKYSNKNGVNFDVCEYTINTDEHEVLSYIYKGKYDVVCFSTYIWNAEKIYRISKNLKSVNPKIKILLGGPEVSFDPKYTLDNHSYIDFVISGEGEIPFYEFAKKTQKLNDFENISIYNEIKFLSYRDNDGSLKIDNEYSLIENLDEIPFPYDNFDDLDHRILYYESSRGCPFNCKYCLSSAFSGVRYFSFDRVKSDLMTFINDNVMQVKFVDRTFNSDPNRALDIMKFIKENDNGITNFHFEITATVLRDEDIEFLKTVRPGLFQLEIGVQTTNKKAAIAINRNMSFEVLRDRCKKLVEIEKTHIHLDLIAGLPYENYESFLKSFDDVYNIKPQMLQLGFLKIIKGSKLSFEIEEHGYIYDNNPPYETFANKYISYDEMIRLSQIEELLEKYYNSGLYTNALDYILKEKDLSPSELYVKMIDYWEQEGLFRLSHNPERLCEIFIDFYKFEFGKDEFFKELVKFEYVLNLRKPAPESLQIECDRKLYKNTVYNYFKEENQFDEKLNEFKGKSAKDIIKKIKWEMFRYDILDYLKTGNKGNDKETIVVFFKTTNANLLNKNIAIKI